MKKTTFSVEIEKDYWDLAFFIKETPDKQITKIINQNSPFQSTGFPLLIEYKSSTKEWGKQIDSFFRQIKKRKGVGERLLVSFDPKFNEFKEACKRAGIILVVLSDTCLKKCVHKE